MAQQFEYTAMGEGHGGFQTTCWTQLQDARTTDDERQRLIIESLVTHYWKPVYCYLRYQGQTDAAAKDHTQGFFTEIVLQRDLFLQADPQKGKFRNFLLTALKRYVTDLHRYESAEKRRPTGAIVALDELDVSRLPVTGMGDSPEDCFNHAWIADLLEEVMLEVKRECRRMEMDTHWRMFEERVLRPALNGKKPPPLPELCEQLGIDGATQASNMIITVKRRLKKALERHLQQFGEAGGPDLAEQVGELFACLNK